MPFFVSSQSLLQWRHFFLWHCHFCVISAVLSVVTVHPLPTQSFVTPSQQTMPTCVILTRHTNTKTVHVQVCYLCSCRAMDACAYIRVGLVANRRVGGVLVAAPALWGRNTNSTAMSSRSFTRHRYRPVTPRRPSSSSELLLHGSWRVRTCTCDSFVLRESHFSNARAVWRMWRILLAAYLKDKQSRNRLTSWKRIGPNSNEWSGTWLLPDYEDLSCMSGVS